MTLEIYPVVLELVRLLAPSLPKLRARSSSLGTLVRLTKSHLLASNLPRKGQPVEGPQDVLRCALELRSKRREISQKYCYFERAA
jgi:hypothetical protein